PPTSYPLSLHDALPISWSPPSHNIQRRKRLRISLLFMAPAFIIIAIFMLGPAVWACYVSFTNMALTGAGAATPQWVGWQNFAQIDRKSTRLNSSHRTIS